MIQRRTRTRRTAPTRAVIFDFDGTIADSLPAIIAVTEELIGRKEPYTPAQIDEMRDLSIPDLLKVLGVPKWKAVVLLFRGRQMLKAHMHGIDVHVGMRDAIKQLHSDGIPLYVLTSNSTENAQKYLQWHKLDQYFTEVYGGVSVLGKAPRLLSLLKKEHMDAGTSWYVGDETRDVIAAKAVGLNVAAVSWGYNTHGALAAHGADAVVDTAIELLKVLEQAWKK